MSKQVKTKKSVMIVDDDADICTVMKKSLGDDYRISTFTNPTLALEHFKQEPARYEMVITDVRMPQMSGFALARAVKSINPQTKIIVMTAFEIKQSEFQKVMPHSMIEGFMMKPVSAHSLKEVLVKL